MDGFEFNVNEKITMKFGIVGGGSPQPEPGGGSAVLTGTTVAQMAGTVLPVSGTIYGTAQEVE